MATAKQKIQVQAVFDLVLRSAQNVKGFDASTQELALLRKAFDGIFNVAQTAPRKAALSWCGYVRPSVCIPQQEGPNVERAGRRMAAGLDRGIGLQSEPPGFARRSNAPDCPATCRATAGRKSSFCS